MKKMEKTTKSVCCAMEEFAPDADWTQYAPVNMRRVAIAATAYRAKSWTTDTEKRKNKDGMHSAVPKTNRWRPKSGREAALWRARTRTICAAVPKKRFVERKERYVQKEARDAAQKRKRIRRMPPTKEATRQTGRPPSAWHVGNAVNADRHTDSLPDRARQADARRRAENQTCGRTPFRQSGLLFFAYDDRRGSMRKMGMRDRRRIRMEIAVWQKRGECPR